MPDELEERLSALAAEIAWPATPSGLWSRAQRTRTAVTPWRRQSRWALAAAAVLLLAATLLAYTPTRDAIAGWLNLHTRITRTENPATPTPRPSAPLGQGFDLGTATTVAGAQQQVAWRIVTPSTLGTPDAVYVKLTPTGPSGGEVTLVYSARPGIGVSGITGVAVLITEARGHTNEQFFQKTLGPEVTIEPVTVAGHSGYWISGRPHGFAFTAADGTPYYDTLRLATNTLIFDDGGTVVRVEGDMSKEQAIEIGRELG
jgi:hypothetical protein